MKNLIKASLFAMMSFVTACTTSTSTSVLDKCPQQEAFDSVVNEIPVKLFHLTNAKGMDVLITNFGGRVVSVCVPDRNGVQQDVVLGFDNLKQYTDSVNSPSDFGAAIGRYANRIKDGKITVDGTAIQLPTNNFGHTLHGGPDGWQYKVYSAEQTSENTLIKPAREFRYSFLFGGHLPRILLIYISYS